MNKRDAKQLADTITHEQLVDMFDRARNSITNWTTPSNANPSISLGAAWNMYYPCLMQNMPPLKLRLVRTNMLWVFGDYLDEALKPKKPDQRKAAAINVFHQEPVFHLAVAPESIGFTRCTRSAKP